MSSDPTLFDVVLVHGQWQVQRDRAPGAVFQRKSDALDRAIRNAEVNRPSTVAVHAENGGVEDKYTFDPS
jgi:hypothetical protein